MTQRLRSGIRAVGSRMSSGETIFVINLLDRRARGSAILIDAGTDRRWTYGEFDRRVRELATHLTSLGVSAHTRVAALLDNSPEFAALYFACLYLRAVIVPINPAIHSDDITFILDHTRTALRVVSPRTISLLPKHFRANKRETLLFGCSDTHDGPTWSIDRATWRITSRHHHRSPSRIFGRSHSLQEQRAAPKGCRTESKAC